MSETIQITIYTYDELSDQAKEKALEKAREYRCKYGYDWAQENFDSLAAFMELWNGKARLSKIQVLSCSFRQPIADMRGKRLSAWLWNNLASKIYEPKYISNGRKHRYSKCQLSDSCVLTGYAMDNALLAPIYDYMHNSKNWQWDIEELLNHCIWNWQRCVQEDYEWQDSEANLREEFADNETRFLEDGRTY